MTTLGIVEQATGIEAVTALVEQRIVAGSDWELASIRRSFVRLEPPRFYWVVYRVRLQRHAAGNGGAVEGSTEQRVLHLAGRACFDPGDWRDFRQRLVATYGEARFDPLGDLGYPILFDQTQYALWCFPVDPTLTTLPAAIDVVAMRRLLRRQRSQLPVEGARIGGVAIEPVRYLPEMSATLRYRVEVGGSQQVDLFGSVRRGDAGAEMDRVMRGLWELSQRSDGALRVPRPLGYHPDLRLRLEEAVSGDTVSGDRTAPEFAAAALAAADALAVIHDSDLDAPSELLLEAELVRLDSVLDQFALTHPSAHPLLRQLLSHIRSQLGRTPEEEWVPTHGDCKYDQFVEHDGAFYLVDFEDAGAAETSWDLGKFCAHAVPSMPAGWEDTAAADDARRAFLERYRELRPHATLQRFPVYEATHLASRAMVAMWSQLRGWRDAAEVLLVVAMERLRSQAP
ncbi:MAG: hypothetical protein E6J14_06060 [Chloroflexi bacterium]|nr:MAG: hypothetical protein E6J14_06060 [Chloroflexota bacterium]